MSEITTNYSRAASSGCDESFYKKGFHPKQIHNLAVAVLFSAITIECNSVVIIAEQ